MFGIETSDDAHEQRGEDRSSAVRLGFEQEYGQRARRGEYRALLGDPLVLDIGSLGGSGHECARDGREQQEGEDLLADAVRVLRVELLMTDVVALLEPIVQLDLPASSVEVADRIPGELAAGKRREEHLRLAVWSATTYRAESTWLENARRVPRGWSQQDVVIVSPRTHELLDRWEGPRCGHAHHEVQSVLDEEVDQDVAGVSAIEYEDVAFARTGEQPAKLRALVRGAGRDHGVDGQLGDDVEQHGDQDLRYVRIGRSAELFPELARALNGHLASIDGQDAAALQPMALAIHLVELIGGVTQELAHSIGREPFARVTEGGSRHGLRHRQRYLVQTGIVPERIEQMLVATPAAVGGHVDQERDHEVGGQRPTTREALTSELEFACDGALNLGGYQSECGTEFSPACLGSLNVSCVGEKKHAAATRDRRGVRILAQRTSVENRSKSVNGIGGSVGFAQKPEARNARRP